MSLCFSSAGPTRQPRQHTDDIDNVFYPVTLAGMKNIRVIIFSVSVLSAGWAGLLIDRITGSSGTNGIGILLFITVPVLAALVLRGFGKGSLRESGMNPHLIKSAVWYAAGLIFPAVYALMYALGRSTDSFTSDAMRSLLSMDVIALALPIAASSFIKNICEEYGFRGYLVPAVFEGKKSIVPHAVVGAVWALWHIPYWLFFLPRDIIASVHADGISVFIVISLVSVFLMSIVYNEIRLISRSIWPAVVLHTIANTASMLFLTHVKYVPGRQWLVGVDGLVSALIVCGIGVIMYRYRTRMASE